MVALAPCVIGYAEIAARLAAQPERVCRCAIPRARAHLDRLAAPYATPAREAELVAIFKEATRLETAFWEMGWRAARRVE